MSLSKNGVLVGQQPASQTVVFSVGGQWVVSPILDAVVAWPGGSVSCENGVSPADHYCSMQRGANPTTIEFYTNNAYYQGVISNSTLNMSFPFTTDSDGHATIAGAPAPDGSSWEFRDWGYCNVQ